MKSIIDTFDKHIEEKRIPGAVAAIYAGEKEIFCYCGGFADTTTLTPLRENSIFRLASMTKPITATAVLIAQEKGLLKLEDPINKYIKNFALKGVGKLVDAIPVFEKEAKDVTIRHTLTHSSGIGSGVVGDWQFARRGNPKTLQEVIECMNGWYLDFEPGTSQAYSGISAMELAAYVVEKVTNTPYRDFLQEEIFYPLGMKDTSYTVSDEQYSRVVKMHVSHEDGVFTQNDLGRNGFGCYAEGSAGLFSTLVDYSAFTRMLAGKGSFKGKKILSEDSVWQMRQPSLSKNIAGISEYFNWGLGVRVCEKQGGGQWLPDGTFGWSGAYGSHFWVEPKTGISAVLMINMGNALGAGSPFSFEFERLAQEELGKK